MTTVQPLAAEAAEESLEDLPSLLLELFKQGATLGMIQGFSQDDLEKMYAVGHGLYTQGRFREAMRIFGFLAMRDHLDMRFARALAACLQMLKQYKQATEMYLLAYAMDMSDPSPNLHVCECLIAQGQGAAAREGLELLLETSDPQRHAGVRAKAQALLEFLDQHTPLAEGGDS